MSTATIDPPPIDTGDRLSFTFFLAAAFHAILILGITFKAELGRRPPPTLEITLATHQSKKAPSEAEYLAQFNQEASGEADTNQLLSTDQLAPIDDALIRQNNPTPQQKRVDASPEQELAPITTAGESQFQATLQQTSEEQLQQARDGADEQDTPLSAEIASLRAKLDRQRRAITKKPRLRRITSVATQASADAEYLNRWTTKVEFVGNRNFPEEAIRQQIYGKLRLATTIRSNGTIQSVEILQSSGHQVLDEAAVQIVHMSAPFPEFPLDLRKDVDMLEIIRTWHFELSGLSTSSSMN